MFSQNTQSRDIATEKINLAGITESVVIDRDEYGIPHIQANNIYDSIFAQGFVEAQDRLWQMEYRRRFANGTLAEILGEAGVRIDRAIRTLGIDDLAQTAYELLSPEVKAIIDGYADGVNAYLASISELPPEFALLGYEPESWLPTDTLGIIQLQNYLVGTTDGGELTRFELLAQGLTPERIEELLPSYGEGDTTILKAVDTEAIEPPESENISSIEALEREILNDLVSLFAPLEASNNWVVSGKRTTTGMPFLASDPHLNLDDPSTWYQTEIDTPELKVIGASLPGVPGIQVGRNENIAWGQTSTLVDTEDFYLLAETPDGEGYIYQGEVILYEIREETIPVRDGETITIEVKDSIYGTVVSDIFGIEQTVALKSLGLEPVNSLVESFFGINQASNWEEFTTALESIVNPINNFVYADIEGNIGYIAPGLYPIRQPGHTGEYPVLGTGEFDWLGFIPTEAIPQLYNPESGYIVTANNQLTPDNYPYEINGRFAESYRAARITELIESKDKLSLEDMKAIQFDRISLLYRDFRPLLEELEPTSELAAEWQERLLDWDGNILPDSQEASVFEAWYVELTRIPGAEVGQEFWDQPRYLQEVVTAEESALALETALNRFGTEIPVWGDIHQAIFTPLLPELSTTEPLQVPLGGDRYTVNVSPNGFEDFNTSFGVSYRQIIDFSNLENSVYINPPGQSGDVTNPNYSNQLSLWQQGEYIPMKTEDYLVTQRLQFNPLLSLPQPQGKYAVGKTNYYWLDPDREETYTENPDDNRDITAQVWYPSETVTGAETAAYFSPELSGAIASGLEIPPEDFINLTQSITTNSVVDAPIASTESEYPVLIFSHGFGDFPELNTIKAEELASQGYVVVSINHTYDSAVNVFPDGRIIPQSSIFDEVESESELIELLGESVNIRAEDAQFVLDKLEEINAGNDPAGLFSGKLDLERVGMYGYSLGGATTANVLSLDSRFKAGINLDGALFGDAANASLSQPFMFLNNEAFGLENSFYNRLQQSFVDNLQNEGYEVTILGTEHIDFNDLSFISDFLLNYGIELGNLPEILTPSNTSPDFEPIDPQLAAQIINDYTVAFFEEHLNNQESPLLADNSSPYPEVIFQAYNSNSPDPLFGTIDGDVLEITSTNELVFAGNGNDLVDATSSLGNNRIYGGDGDDTLILGTGDRVIAGAGADRFFAVSGGDNILTGGADADQFWIASAQIPDSPNIITDLDLTEDIIGIAGLDIEFDDLIISQQEDNVLINVNGRDIAIFQRITANQLGADNFLFT